MRITAKGQATIPFEIRKKLGLLPGCEKGFEVVGNALHVRRARVRRQRSLDRFFAILSEGPHRFESTVNQYTGDGIMTLFGAPITHEDHAQRDAAGRERALRAALRLYTERGAPAHAVRLEQELKR